MSNEKNYGLPEELVVASEGAVRVVTINRSNQQNAVNASLHLALSQVWSRIQADSEARAVVLTGVGKNFCAGGDFDWLSSFLDDAVPRNESLRQGAQIIEEMLRFPLPIIAAINGPAVGLGCSLAALCDIVLVSDRAFFADPHVSVGLVAGDGGAALWPLLGPIMRSREYLFTGEKITPEAAIGLGLATRVVQADSLMEEALKLAQKVAKQPPQAVQGTKRILNMHLSRSLTGAVQMGFVLEGQTMATEDHRKRLQRLQPKDPRS